MDTCLADGFQIDQYVMHEANGEFIGRMQLMRIAGTDIPAVNGLPRTTLHRILTDAAEAAGARIRLGLTVSSITSHDDRADVVLSDGSKETYDLVVGADGIRSHVRQMIFGREFDPQYTGHGVWRFTVQRTPDVTHQIMLYGVGIKAGVMPVSHDQMYLLLVTNEPDNPWMAPERLADLLRERLQPFTAPVVTAIRDQIDDPSKVIYGPIEEVILPPPWHRGRVLLIGDAAHASGPMCPRAPPWRSRTPSCWPSSSAGTFRAKPSSSSSWRGAMSAANSCRTFHGRSDATATSTIRRPAPSATPGCARASAIRSRARTNCGWRNRFELGRDRCRSMACKRRSSESMTWRSATSSSRISD